MPNLDTFTLWLVNYGSISLFFLLALGIVALPIPEETLMVIAGALMSNGTLGLPSTIISAYLGSVCGISLSYTLGKTVGLFFIHKYGRWVGLTQKRLNKAHRWFEHFGKWSSPLWLFYPGDPPLHRILCRSHLSTRRPFCPLCLLRSIALGNYLSFSRLFLWKTTGRNCLPTFQRKVRLSPLNYSSFG